MRRFGTALILATIGLAACSDDPAGFETELEFPAHEQGDIISLRADGIDIEFISRRTGEIFRLNRSVEPNSIDTLATVDVGIDGEQRGLLGHTTIEGRRFAAWTEPGTLKLVVGDVTSGEIDRIVWAGTTTRSKAIGGHLETFDGQILLGLGELTGWGEDHGSGALVLLDPDGPPEQDPIVLSSGWNNPFAFAVTTDGAVWVADNAPDGSDLPVAERDGERIARAIPPDGPAIVEPPPQRAPGAIVELPDRRLGVCGFLDNEMRAYQVSDPADDSSNDRSNDVPNDASDNGSDDSSNDSSNNDSNSGSNDSSNNDSNSGSNNSSNNDSNNGSNNAFNNASDNGSDNGSDANSNNASDNGAHNNGSVSAVERAGTIGPCQTGAAVLSDGTIVTVSTTDRGTTALLARPPA